MSQTVTDYKFGTKPYAHQEAAFLTSRDREAYAYLMEQGTGKTKVIIDNFCWLFQEGKINGVLIVCPKNMVKTWALKELPAHVPGHVYAHVQTRVWRQKLREVKATQGGLTPLDVLVMNHDAFITEAGYKLAQRFCLEHTVFMAIDESTCIKNPAAKRSKALHRIGKQVDFRRIATGTPIDNSPFDAYSQFKFLDPSIVTTESFTAFKNEYGVTEPRRFKRDAPLVNIVTGYKNLEKLRELIAPHSFFAYKKDCLDLPEKVYQKVFVELTPKQRKAYEDLQELTVHEFSENARVSAPIALTRLLRFHQITSGWVTLDEQRGVHWLENPPPKLTALLELLETLDGKAIIWAQYQNDIELVTATLNEKYGPLSASSYYGLTSDKARDHAEESFQDPAHPLRFFVGNPQAGGVGLTLTQAETVVYYSNSYRLLDRLQSEDRAHRIGQRKVVTYYDIVAENSVDERIIDALRNKRHVASEVTGATLTEWL